MRGEGGKIKPATVRWRGNTAKTTICSEVIDISRADMIGAIYPKWERRMDGGQQ